MAPPFTISGSATTRAIQAPDVVHEIWQRMISAAVNSIRSGLTRTITVAPHAVQGTELMRHCQGYAIY